MLQVAVQPFASVTVNVCVPAVKPLCIPVPLYGAVPPDADTDADPLLPPLQFTFDTTEHVALSAVGSVIVTLQFAVQPFASVTVYV